MSINTQYTPDQFFTSHPVHVRFRDLDPLNHVNNAVFNTYFEEARIAFILEVPELRAEMESHYSFVLAHLDLHYLKPIHLREPIAVYSSLMELGNSSITGIQAIFNTETQQCKAVAKTTGVWFDVSAGRPARLPDIANPDHYLIRESDG
ncbi:MAG: acyl-CoA thioesterase [Balneolaceae bacterium]